MLVVLAEQVDLTDGGQQVAPAEQVGLMTEMSHGVPDDQVSLEQDHKMALAMMGQVIPDD